MSAASVVLFFFLCLLAVFWQIRFNRGMKLSGEEADSHPGCVVILAVGFFAAFVIFRRYYDFFPSPELQEIRERQGVFGDILRGLVRQVILQIIITLAIKSLLFALTVFLCFRLAPLFLIYCIGALSHIYVEGLDSDGIPLLHPFAAWLFEGAPDWVSVWYIRIQIGVSVLTTLIYYEPPVPQQQNILRTFVGFVFDSLFGFIGSLFQRFRQWREPSGSDSLFGYDFSQGYTSLEKQADSPAKQHRDNVAQQQREADDRWMDELLDKMKKLGAAALTPEERSFVLQHRLDKRTGKKQTEQQQREADDRRMDELLEKIQRHGKDGLTQDERDFLQKVADRYRKS